MDNNNRILVKGITFGIIISLAWEVSIALGWVNICLGLGFPILSLILFILILFNTRVRYITYEILIAIVLAVISFYLLRKLNISTKVFYMVHPNLDGITSGEMTGGDGMQIMLITFIWLCMVGTSACIACYYAGRKLEKK